MKCEMKKEYIVGFQSVSVYLKINFFSVIIWQVQKQDPLKHPNVLEDHVWIKSDILHERWILRSPSLVTDSKPKLML